MAKKLSKKELQKLEIQMGISKVSMTARRLEDRPCSMVRQISRNEGKVRWRRRSADCSAQINLAGSQKRTG